MVDSLKLAEQREKTFVVHYVAIICTTNGETEQMRACGVVMIHPPELPINDEARNDARIASTGVRLYRRGQIFGTYSHVVL